MFKCSTIELKKNIADMFSKEGKYFIRKPYHEKVFPIPSSIINHIRPLIIDNPEACYQIGFLIEPKIWYLFKNQELTWSSKKIKIPKKTYSRYEILRKSFKKE